MLDGLTDFWAAAKAQAQALGTHKGLMPRWVLWGMQVRSGVYHVPMEYYRHCPWVAGQAV